MTKKFGIGIALSGLVFLTGCAFDISHVKQRPAAFAPGPTPARQFTLVEAVKVTVGSGFPTRLKAGTRWRQVGRLDQGDVFATQDQIVTVEASNIYEAQLVVTGDVIAGFYLPIEKTFVAATSRPRIRTTPIETSAP